MKFALHTLLLTLALALVQPSAHAGNDVWLDGLSITVGASEHPESTDIYRIGMQKKWRRSWFKGGAWYLGGYWDTELARMQADVGATKKVYAVSLTPVLRYQRDAHISSGVTPFAEAGLGLHLLSENELGNNNLSTTYQFGSLLGLGVGFGEKGQYELSYRFTHISNADIKEPNDSLDLHLVKLGYNFN